MCRWIAYTGEPIYLDNLVTKPDHSLVVQSLNSKMNYTNTGQLLSTNGDGFGIGWYDKREQPGVFRDDLPAWHNNNLQNLCHQVKAHTFMAHVRATTTGDIQRTNCHPFAYKNWLFQHNGHVSDFSKIRRELQLSLDPGLFAELRGTTDSETFFLLALTYGLMNNPKQALKKMVTRVLECLQKVDQNGVLNLSCAISDGRKLYILRFSHGEAAMTQFYSTRKGCLDDMEGAAFTMPPNSAVVVSEPLDKISEKWTKIPNNSFTCIQGDKVDTETFLEH